MRPLEGVTIIDLTHALAGPFCTYQLALLGADVIKIENTKGGDDFRGLSKPTFDAVNAGKTSVFLNLKNPDALPVLERLVRGADVLIDNFKPGTAQKFGITWEKVKSWNDKAIWCSISGFGLEGPWRDLPAVEWSVQAASGLTESYIDDSADPRDPGLGILDLSSGHAAATAILAALLRRAKTGTGERIDVAMIDVALSLQSTRIGSPGGSRMPRRPAVGRFQAKNARVFVMGAHQRWFETISTVLGEPHLVNDPRFADVASRQANADALQEAMEARLQTRNAEEWEAAFTAAGMPASVVRRLTDVVSSDHMRQRGGIHAVSVSGVEQGVSVMGTPYQLADGPVAPSKPVPALGEHTDEVLGRFGYSASDLGALRAAGVL